MKTNSRVPLTKVIGSIPNRLALAGGWIDQPFVSRLNPKPPGSMVVVALEPTFRVMDRAGCASGTRAVAIKLWNGRLPNRPAGELVRELYAAENQGKAEPSGSQDMIGLIYPGINRLDYDFGVHGGVFPSHIESLNSAREAQWLERVLHLLPIEPRPEGYNPLGEKHLDPKWIARLGQTGRDCFEAIRRMDAEALGASFNACMECWETILPHTVRHPTVKVDLQAILRVYQQHYPGAMYSGCGGGYLFVASKEPVPGAFQVTIRIADK
ncbi:MAG TPA: hypothetical protein VNT26_20805 [Candidatus Sulfotelmatobacter sp.]|nr:hypothetical protein [Candidatus Sulfotelmatobacter sp.]